MIWKPFLENYLISEEGDVLNKYTGKTLRRGNISSGKVPYMVVSLSHKGTKKSYILKKLIATLFVSNPNNYKHVIQRDGNPLNFKSSNLQWAQYKEWTIPQRGKNTIKRKKVLIESLLCRGYPVGYICEIANTYNVALNTVYNHVYNVL